MESPKYPIKKVEKEKVAKLEQQPDVPIIDVIRHGETRYKQRENGYINKPLDTSSPDFKLDSEHLDLTDRGIASMRATAEQLADMIDRNNEVVLVVSSPSWRAHSSGLVVEEVLRNKGISILNGQGEFKFAEALNDSDSRYEKLRKKEAEDLKSGKYPEPGYDTRQERHKIETLAFQRFLRHMNNIYKWLKPETLAKINGKRLRIVCLTHAEMTNEFISQAFDVESDNDKQARSQILEINPQSQLLASQETLTDVKLHQTRPPVSRGPEEEGQIARGFNPDAKEEMATKIPFAMDNWKYQEYPMHYWTTRLAFFAERNKSKSFPDRRAAWDALSDLYFKKGGKAFGLKVCELVAENLKAADYNLRVPSWRVVDDIRSIDTKEKIGKILGQELGKLLI